MVNTLRNRSLFALLLLGVLFGSTSCASGNGPANTLCVRDHSRSEVMGNPVGHETATRRVMKARRDCAQNEQ